MIRTCDGSDPESIMYLQIDGRPADHPEFAVTSINCDCGSAYDDEKHDRIWPHRFAPPVRPERVVADLPDIAGLL